VPPGVHRGGIGPERVAGAVGDDQPRPGPRGPPGLQRSVQRRDDLLGDDAGAIWARWTSDLALRMLQVGHVMAEEAPDAVVPALRELLGR
jgi:hypothetical protein